MKLNKCIPPYIKAVISDILGIYLIILAVNESPYIIILMLILVFVNDKLIKCQKCKKPLYIRAKGWYGPFTWSNPFLTHQCDKCGQNLLKCDIEEFETKPPKSWWLS